jgi:CheY-like chemotaxis protein
MGRRILTDAGYEVITVNNGSAALKKIHEIRPDLIVLDVYMPGYGGLEVCQRLKESGDTSKIPVLLSVGKMEPFKADEAKRVRADAHIVKPFEASELLAALAKLEDRIVPQAESSKGRKSKKPSFWHDDDSKTPRDWSDNAEYLAQVKERKSSSKEEIAPEPSPEEPAPAPSSKVGAFPLVHEATGELPVVPDSAASEEQSAAVALAPQADVADLEPREASSKVSVDVSEDKPTEVEKETKAAAQDESSTTAPLAPRWVAENVALSPEEAALELEQEMRAAEAAESTQKDSSTTDAPAAVAEVGATDNQGAAFAAAAGASAGASTTSAVASATDEAETSPGSEAAAAWQNWQQIRDTVMNVNTAEALAETVAQTAKAAVPAEEVASPQPDSHDVETSATKAAPVPDAQPSELDGALASIVDSVLAELKPKLMQEISKKLKK